MEIFTNVNIRPVLDRDNNKGKRMITLTATTLRELHCIGGNCVYSGFRIP